MKQLLTGLLILIWSLSATANDHWQDIVTEARGQTVYFNAWGGNAAINEYIQWAAAQAEKQYGIKIQHVKVNHTTLVVKRIAAEVKAGRQKPGSVDLIWINGENFSRMKRENLLFGPWVGQLPNWQYVDQTKPVQVDFSVATSGLESPWGSAQLCFIVDLAVTPNPPVSAQELLAFAKKNPGKVSYPAPPDFHGSTLIKQLLIELSGPAWFQKPVDPQFFAQLTQPLWDYLEQLHPYMWQEGKVFPPSAAEMNHMLADGTLKLSLSFNPNEVRNLIARHVLPETAASYGFTRGMIGNVHFVAIPANARAKEAAQVFANFLLSPQAQARKADITVWGDGTVLDPERLSVTDKHLFQVLSTQSLMNRVPTLAEPHSSWMQALEEEWLRRYGGR
nr:ABC transporter substrate-binding protein [Vibrio quintilis]